MPNKRVSQQTYKRRRMVALAVIILLLIIIICLISSACSNKNSNTVKGKSTVSTTPASSATQPFSSVSTATSSASQKTSSTVTTTAISGTLPDDGSNVQSIELSFNSVTLSIGESQMPIVTMGPDTAEDKSEKWSSSDASIASVDDVGNITGVKAGTCYITVASVNNPRVYAEVKVTVTDSASTSSNTSLSNTAATNSGGVTTIQGIVIANKSYPLPQGYDPGLDATTKSQFDALSAAAAAEGLNIYLASGYRSYSTQERIYNNYVANYGQESADTFSARPGYSEHQTGLAIDLNSIDDSFADTPEYTWLVKHAHEYGFIIRYPADKVSITGYKYEPWHIRYLGVDTATAVYKSGKCLEEYLGINSQYAN